MMLRRLVSFIIAIMFIVEGSFVYASPFIEMEHMYGNVMYKLKTNGPIQRTYDTPTGQLALRLTVQTGFMAVLANLHLCGHRV